MEMSDEGRRLIMRSSDVAACFAAIGKVPPPLSLFAGLAAAPAEPSAFLLAKNGKLAPLVQAIFDVLANTSQVIRLANLTQDSALAIETAFLSAGEDGPYVMLARREDDVWDMAHIGKRDGLLAALDMLLGLSALDPMEEAGEAFAIDLDLPALAVLAALSDLVSRDQAKALLERRAANLSLLSTPLPLAHIREAIIAEQAQGDIRSVLSRLSLLSGGALLADDAAEIARAGLIAMRTAKLLDDDDVPLQAALGLIAILQQSDPITGMTRLARGEGEVRADALALLHTSGQTLLGLWHLDEKAQPSAFRIVAAKPDKVLSALDAFCAGETAQARSAAPAAKFCAQCGTALSSGQKFCKQCGAKLGA